MKILIIGAGITGLSMGYLLKDYHSVKILEKDSRIGGIAKTKQVNDISYHTIGGHCFNSKHKDVLDFVFNILPKAKWHNIQRISRISLDKYEVDYPIEYSIRQIFEYDKDLALKITTDFLASKDDYNYKNLEDWFIKKFGNTLSNLYFIPYNTKIWAKQPSEMSAKWVEDKLPIPDKISFFEGLIHFKSDNMPHSSFYYPNTNDQQTFINNMAEGLDIECNVEITKITKSENGWLINDSYNADLIISTIPLNILPRLIQYVPDHILDCTSLLKYNKVSNVLWESKPTNKTWTYKPMPDTIFHRYIHIGNFFKPTTNNTITEAIGEHTFEEMIEYGSKDPFLIKPLDHNVSEHAYIIFDENREYAVNNIQNYLNKEGIISIGRFGQWDYFNMDICIKQSILTFKKIMKTL